jgi:hypothetical protein
MRWSVESAMEEQKRNVDIRVILEQLNIPMEKFEQWNSRERAEKNRSIRSKAWVISSRNSLLSMEK